jgi:hypothetical protein
VQLSLYSVAVVVHRVAVVRRLVVEGEDLEVVVVEHLEDAAAVVRRADAEGMHLEAAAALEGVEVGDKDLSSLLLFHISSCREFLLSRKENTNRTTA